MSNVRENSLLIQDKELFHSCGKKNAPGIEPSAFSIFQINCCAFLFGIMSRRANHSQSDRPIANPAECDTHDARPSFRLKRGLYSFLEAVRCLPVCE